MGEQEGYEVEVSSVLTMSSHDPNATTSDQPPTDDETDLMIHSRVYNGVRGWIMSVTGR